ncbi:MAG: ORF6N domain-containing protein [Bacteroidales bacterium]|nr:ORF6N domain-containing protein [Bacteroidales bacterium]
MTKEKNTLTAQTIQERILTIRGVQVILDSDLAEMYQVETRILNQAVKRNSERFPDDFMFQLTKDEFDNILISQFVISSSEHGGRRKLPFVFTEQGVSMLSSVLKSEIAVRVSLSIIRAFVQMRKLIIHNAAIFQRIENVEKKQLQADSKIDKILNALEDKSLNPKQGIFFEGQIFDAYAFVISLIKSAKNRIVVIDNYIDESVLTMISKRKKNVSAIVYSSHVTKQLQLDLQKHNQQYEPIGLHEFSKSHDRFLIIDAVVYHFGASLKDLGKKWFAFSKMEMSPEEILSKLNG